MIPVPKINPKLFKNDSAPHVKKKWWLPLLLGLLMVWAVVKKNLGRGHERR